MKWFKNAFMNGDNSRLREGERNTDIHIKLPPKEIIVLDCEGHYTISINSRPVIPIHEDINKISAHEMEKIRIRNAQREQFRVNANYTVLVTYPDNIVGTKIEGSVNISTRDSISESLEIAKSIYNGGEIMNNVVDKLLKEDIEQKFKSKLKFQGESETLKKMRDKKLDIRFTIKTEKTEYM